MRRSDVLASSATAMARKSLTKPIGSAWKLPPDSTSSPKISGLSETPLMAAPSTSRACAQRVLDRAEHLRHAAHGVGILHAFAVLVAATDLAVGIEQRADAPRGVDLPRQAARLLDAIVERRVAAGETFDGQRAADDRGVEQRLGTEQAVERQRQAQLRAVQQREAFLRLQFERLERQPRAARRCP